MLLIIMYVTWMINLLKNVIFYYTTKNCQYIVNMIYIVNI